MYPISIIDKEAVFNSLYYDTSSPSCLRWRVSKSSNINPDDPAGSLNRLSNRYELTLNYKRYSVSRIVMILHGFENAPYYVDHINGNPSDNRIENLRYVTPAGNQRNRKVSVSNSSGIPGITFTKIENGSKTKINTYYQASYFDLSGKEFRKKFNIEKLGDSVALQMAIEYRKSGIIEVNNLAKEINQSGYSDRHLNLELDL